MATILTTTGISVLQNAKRYYNSQQPTDDQIRQFLRLQPERASAEVNSLLKFAQLQDEIVLLHTDTLEALQCARFIKEFLERQDFNRVRLVELQIQEDEKHLETRGLRNLVNALITEVEQAERRDQEVIINATTGFKAEVVYSTMIGMLYRIPIKYIYEKFQRLVTFSPIPLDWDTSLIISHAWFFDWIDEEPRMHRDVENILKGIPDKERIKALLTLPDEENHVFLSAIGEALIRRFKREMEESTLVPWPAAAEVDDIEDKIAVSILKSKHHYPDGLLEACYKIANLDPVLQVIGGNFENTTMSRIKRINDDGAINLLWADNTKAGNLIVLTTARGRPQTLKVADRIKEVLKLR